MAETCISKASAGHPPVYLVPDCRSIQACLETAYSALIVSLHSSLLPHPSPRVPLSIGEGTASTPTPPNLVHATEYLTHCASSGGGIIDMMNRRLRERLTEAEILQIFVDVCEGVAAMHNLRPALLHRDLKVCHLPFSPFHGPRRSQTDSIVQSFN